MAAPLVLVVFASLLAVAVSQSSDVYSSNYAGFSGPYQWTNQPAPREGTVYGNNAASQYVYFAGGVELVSAALPNVVYTDVWALDWANQQFVKASATLPSGSYFGVGGWGYKTNSLWVHNGRNNSDSSGNTYWAGLVQLSYSSSVTQPTLTSHTLSTAVDGRQYASSIIFTPASTGVETMFVFGGLTGTGGADSPTINFYSIALQGAVGTVTPLTQTGNNLPITSSATAVTSNPTMFVNPQTFAHLYFYGGLDGSGDVFGDPSKIYIYSIATNAWLAPTSPAHSAYSAVSFNPYIVYSGTILTADFTQVILLGGDYGLGNATDSEANGTHNQVFHIDCTPLTAANPSAQPYVSQLKYSLPYRVESPVSALIGNTTIVSWSGSEYINEEQNDAAAYVNGTVYATQTGNNHASSTQSATAVWFAVTLAATALAAMMV